METESRPRLPTLPNDDIRNLMWRLTDRFDLQMLIQSARTVARGPVANAVAQGARNSHDWTEQKAQLLDAFDASGITSFFMNPELGGYIDGPKNIASALVAFELAWVDGGAATCSLAGNLALEPIHEKGTPEQKLKYMGGAIPPAPGEDRKQLRGAFSLTEPLPYVGVETGTMGGKLRVAEWEEGKEPTLQVEKRGRFITNMDFANFSSVAVDSDDERIKGSCMIVVEETDPGVFDRGAPTKKLVHQLSSTRDPVFSMKVPADRIIGGYTIQDGIIVPNFSHGEVIEAVFKRTRVTVGLMTSAKLLSAIEPIIRYHRTRFRGGTAQAGTPRFDLGIQLKEDVLHRLTTIWGMGEAGASLGFATARLFDELDSIEKEKDKIMAEKGIERGRAEFRALMKVQKEVLNALETKNYDAIRADTLQHYVWIDSLAIVLCPACKLWNTGQGATTMREAVSLMGGYGITEDCPGFLGQKWMDAQLEATYEGPEAVQRRQLTVTMTNKIFLTQIKIWIEELNEIAKDKPNLGARAVASAMELWLMTLDYLQSNKDENGSKLYSSSRQGANFPMADALCWLLASRYQTMDILELEQKGPENPTIAEGLAGFVRFFSNLSQVQAARGAGEVTRVCTELFFGYRSTSPQGAERKKFNELRNQIEDGIVGACLAKDQAGDSITHVMIPEALDYPA